MKPGNRVVYSRNLVIPSLVGCSALWLLAGVAEDSVPTGVPRSLAYVLQGEGVGRTKHEAVDSLARCERDWLVIDASYTGSRNGAWTADDLHRMRAAHPGRKILAYLSIGEAEIYRDYWQPEWDEDRDGRPDPQAPAWLCEENPDWVGNYKVRYWHAEWQEIMLQELDRVIGQGFDGVYLDIVDAFEYFEFDPEQQDWIDHRLNPDTGRSYREEMHRWVSRIAERGRRVTPGFLVVPQNGAQLLEFEEYVSLIDGIGIEDLFTNGEQPQDPDQVAYLLSFLDRLRQANQPVLVIEYAVEPELRRHALDSARSAGLLLLLTDRELKTLGESHDMTGLP